MSGVNKVILIGNLGGDPECRYLPSGDAVTTITLATSETWTDKATNQKKEETTWHKVVFFGRLAEIAAEYLTKGSKVYVEGQIKHQKYKDKDTGQDRYSTSIKANTLQMLDTQARQAPANNAPANQAQAAQNAQEFDNEIPF